MLRVLISGKTNIKLVDNSNSIVVLNIAFSGISIKTFKISSQYLLLWVEFIGDRIRNVR